MKKSKATRKLFAAAMGLGLAVVSTVGSTYAWFSMNSTVTATGMNVQVQSESTLLIDTANTLTNGRLAAGAATKVANSEIKSLKPTSTINGTSWYKAEAAEANATTAKSGSYTEVDSGDYANYLASYQFYLQVFDKSQEGAMHDPAKDITVKDITVASSVVSTNISNCLRVMVKQDSTTVFTAPIRTTTNQGVASVTDGAATMNNISWAAYTKDGNKATLSSNNKLVDSVVYNTVYPVTVYIYFDGEDTDCFSDNIPTAAQLATYTIDISFALVDHA